MASVAKDFHRLLKRVGKLTDGQATIVDIDWDEGHLKNFYVILKPNGGFYKNGKFKFEIKLTDEYLEIPPVVWCHTDIYHPNIDPTEECYGDTSTNVCLNVFENGVWNRSFGLEGAILGLLFLMHNPNLQDPLSPYFEGSDDEEVFEENVRKYMAGEEFDDISFEKDFCVKDGILITEPRTVSPETKDESVDMAVGQIECPKIVNDVISVSNLTISNNDSTADDSKNIVQTGSVIEATNELQEETTKCSFIEQNIIKEDNSDDIVDKELDNNANSVTDKNTDGLNDPADADDECSKCDIELVNIDGECVLLINSSMQETNNMTETHINETASIDTDALDRNDVDIQENCEIKTDTGVVCIDHDNAKEDSHVDTSSEPAETNISCNLDNSANVDIDLRSKTACITEASLKEEHDENSDIGDMSPILDTAIHLNGKQGYLDEDSQSKDVKCGCGAWWTIRSAFSKIAHTIGHNKLYRDIGL